MQLSITCIKKPVFTIVLNLIVIVLGLIFGSRLQIRDTPNINPPVITVQSNYAGADAFFMEEQVTNRIEDAVKTTTGLDFMTSDSSVGESSVVLVFKLDTDIEIALNDVRSKVSNITYLFPEDMRAPAVSKVDSDSFPSFFINIDSDRHDGLELTRIADNLVKTSLEKLSDVGSTAFFGSKVYSMNIFPDNLKMLQHKVSPLEIEQAVRAQNKDYPAGFIKSKVRIFTLRLNSSLSSVQEFENIIIRKNPDGSLLKLSDVATVSLSEQENNIYLRYKGNNSMILGLIVQSDANIITLSNNATAELEKIKKNLPQGVNLSIAYDAALPVKESIKSVFITIFEAIILVAIVTYLFLGSIKITLIPLVTIPISLIGSLIFMYLCNFSINNFTLLAMILAIGLVVDDAIVMLENIFRHAHELGKSALQAAYDGSKEIAFAVVAMTITLAAVFMPVGFIEGFLGKLFIEFAWTLAFCVLFSGFVALTLSPMMSSRMVEISNSPKIKILQKFDYLLDRVQGLYVKGLKLLLNNKKYFFLACGVLIMLLGSVVSGVDKVFIPEEDQGFLQVMFNGPEGSSINETTNVVMQTEKIMNKEKDLDHFFSVIGWQGENKAVAFVPLVDWSLRNRSQDEIKNSLNEQFRYISGMSVSALSPRLMGGGGSDKIISFNLQTSDDYDLLDRFSNIFIQRMNENNELFQNVERDFYAATPTLDVVINRDKAYQYGIDLFTIGNTLQLLVAGKEIGNFILGKDVYNVIIQYQKEQRSSANSVKNILLKTRNNNVVPIEAIADIKYTSSIKSYKHYDSDRSVNISSDLAPGANLTKAIAVIEKIKQEIIGNNNIYVKYIGEIDRMNESSSSIFLTFLFAIVFIYLVLSAQFESFSDALLILLTVPFSVVGGILSLFLFNNTINMYSNIGLVTLIGLVTKNSIMIVEFTNQLKEEGENLLDAVVKAAKIRLRPILMTSIATICGSIPLLFATGAGAASRRSIGIVIFGGMIIGTIFTVFVIPVLYHSFKRERESK